jgi:large subunit ribosomal protein L25
MELTISKREKKNKSDINKIRREGNIPAVLYAPGKNSENVVVKGEEFLAVLRSIKPGHLATKTFTLKGEKEQHKAIVKDIQYDVTSYKIIHLDFQLVSDEGLVKVNVPIVYLGQEECAGVKLGGILHFVIRALPVECLAKDIPEEFTLDIRSLAIEESRRLSDLQIPKNVKPLKSLKEIAIVVAKPLAT